jgi:hypothetical protein
MCRTQELFLIENQFLIQFPEDYVTVLSQYIDSKMDK